jgi:hypothetical protein
MVYNVRRKYVKIRPNAKNNDQTHKTLTFKAKNPASHIPVDKPP